MRVRGWRHSLMCVWGGETQGSQQEWGEQEADSAPGLGFPTCARKRRARWAPGRLLVAGGRTYGPGGKVGVSRLRGLHAAFREEDGGWGRAAPH